ncbi:hypothetical protein DPEC_G00023620 [Dallia pectoralis]|uniref:Uncharacterized protein n=1 Tax=Dallia pectoralis TaxID=75939 RepID=A0ACC2HGZ8_DALPE|nr:hypothetical protein DPEC_G00023620 [Dallia pectoralis]
MHHDGTVPSPTLWTCASQRVDEASNREDKIESTAERDMGLLGKVIGQEDSLCVLHSSHRAHFLLTTELLLSRPSWSGSASQSPLCLCLGQVLPQPWPGLPTQPTSAAHHRALYGSARMQSEGLLPIQSQFPPASPWPREPASPAPPHMAN